MQNVPQIRIFLASPGDVNEERAVALEVLDMLEYDPLFKRDGAGGVSIHAVAWDKPGGDTPLRATMTPQTAIKQGLPRPSQCDIVIVLFWGRMGTPLPHPEYRKEDGSPYLSGTEWEYWDAVTAERTHGKPITLIYRRTEDPHIDMKDRKAIAQYHTVLDFFEQFRDPNTGALLGGVNEYTTPEDLRQKLVNHLRVIIDDILTSGSMSTSEQSHTAASVPSPALPLVEAPPLWNGSPFPGLRAFDEKDAPIFCGRGQETSELVKRVESNRFVGVVAASGSGKSSLVAAGLLPRLRSGAIITPETNSATWRFVRLTPGLKPEDGPFEALFAALCEAFPEHPVSPFMIEQEKHAFVESITRKSAALVSIGEALLREAKAPDWAEILFFIDQFEELFTVVRKDDRASFVALLEAIAQSKRLRCVVTMRSDFYADCLELPALTALLKEATYPLGVPTAGALIEMIKRPAERAGLTWNEGLPERIQADTGTEPGALALMAYALDELYKSSRDNHCLTFEAYRAIGEVAGAIGKRAETVYSGLALPNKERLFQRVFRELVTVNPTTGAATRQRAAAGVFSADEIALIRAFVKARLLVAYDHTVEVAHEAVFRSWERLREWIEASQEDLILLRQVRSAADEWARRDQPDFLRWPAERLKPVYEMIERQEPPLNEHERDFIEPEQERLLREIADLRTDHKRRRWIGERLATIGDLRSRIGLDERGLPQLDWLPVAPGGEIEIGEQRFSVQPFYVAKYLITYAQFEAFIKAPDGFADDRWWQGFPSEYVKQEMYAAIQQYGNYPRDSVSWYQSVAFARWLGAKYREHGLFKQFAAGNWQLRLPTEWEWQWMAQHGAEARKYPWGAWDEYPHANTTEAGIGDRSTAVSMYPDGAAVCGALDVAGNLWEWCLNKYDKPGERMIDDGRDYRVLRGGSFLDFQYYAACAYRFSRSPQFRNSNVGLRVVVGPLMR